MKFFRFLVPDLHAMVTTQIRFALYTVLLAGWTVAHAQLPVKIAKLKYNGGGDWYANKTSLPNRIKFANAEVGMSIAPEEDIVEVGSRDLFLYPYVYMTGHGNVVFSESEAANLRKYLIGGGFLRLTPAPDHHQTGRCLPPPQLVRLSTRATFAAGS